jgi:signal transduction histidine kinase
MSRHSMIEARRSVWDLRCHLLEDGDLVSAMSQITEPLVREDADVRVNIIGTPVRLSGRIEMNLLRIGQEAVANALKHGQARHVDIELQYAPESVRLTVKDDGSGFDPSASSPAGHFGLLDMRERAQSMNSRLEIASEAAFGTRITVNVPLVSAPTHAELKANTYSRS